MISMIRIQKNTSEIDFETHGVPSMGEDILLNYFIYIFKADLLITEKYKRSRDNH